MKPSEALMQHRDAIRVIVESNRGANPRVFGSVAHGTDTEDSDLDIVIERLPGLSLFDLAKIHLEIEDLLGISVDVVTLGSIPERVVDDVLVGSLSL
ncbi:MAG: nucleotidyltransferase family protein [Thermomicrobiales bacterium]